MILSLSSTKGGPGKTTITGCIADYWLSAGIRIAMLDTDPNRNLTHWYEKRAEGAFEGAAFRSQPNEDSIIADAEALCDAADIVVIDVAGVGSRSLLYAAGISDLVVIPAQPSEDDLVEAINTRRIVDNASRLAKRSIPLVVALNRVNPQAAVYNHTLNQLTDADMPRLKTTVGNRTVFQKARFMGATPQRFEPEGLGAKEIRNLGDELLSAVGWTTRNDAIAI